MNHQIQELTKTTECTIRPTKPVDKLGIFNLCKEIKEGYKCNIGMSNEKIRLKKKNQIELKEIKMCYLKRETRWTGKTKQTHLRICKLKH